MSSNRTRDSENVCVAEVEDWSEETSMSEVESGLYFTFSLQRLRYEKETTGGGRKFQRLESKKGESSFFILFSGVCTVGLVTSWCPKTSEVKEYICLSRRVETESTQWNEIHVK